MNRLAQRRPIESPAPVGSGEEKQGQTRVHWGYELTVISAAVIGGTSLLGGIGSLGGTVVGAALIGAPVNGLQLSNVSSHSQQVTIGFIVIAAVAFHRRLKTRAELRAATPR